MIYIDPFDLKITVPRLKYMNYVETATATDFDRKTGVVCTSNMPSYVHEGLKVPLQV